MTAHIQQNSKQTFHYGYHIKRLYDHMRFLDFSFLTGRAGYYLWKFHIISTWQKLFTKRYHLLKQKTEI
jgi:hypothetical protein